MLILLHQYRSYSGALKALWSTWGSWTQRKKEEIEERSYLARGILYSWYKLQANNSLKAQGLEFYDKKTCKTLKF